MTTATAVATFAEAAREVLLDVFAKNVTAKKYRISRGFVRSDLTVTIAKASYTISDGKGYKSVGETAGDDAVANFRSHLLWAIKNAGY